MKWNINPESVLCNSFRIPKYEELVVCYLNLRQHYSDGDDHPASIHIKRGDFLSAFTKYEWVAKLERSSDFVLDGLR